MSINRLNLQIGGPGPEEYDKRKVMREVRGVDSEIDSLLEDLYVEETQVQYINESVEEYEPTVEENVQTRQERMAESISLYHSKTRQSLEEVAPVSDADRIKLLEDAFAQMRRAQPQTLVSGIGASLDSGGGAVWLWDLEDVNIGVPLDGTYPVIADNSVLKYDSDTSKWIVGSAEDSGQDLPLSGGTMSGDIVFNTGQTFPGTLELAGGTMTGNITFKAGQTFPGTLPLTGGAITGDTTYAGSTAGDTNLQTKTSVNALISAAVDDGFVFKGTTDVTGAAPTPAAGNFYINTVAGTASASWTGIATLTISADQLVIYSGSESRWFAGAVEDNTSFLAKTGGTMTGDIVFAGTQTFPSSITSGLLPKSGGTMTGTLITDEIEVPLGKTLTIKRGNNNTSSSGLDIKGYQPGQFTAQTDILGVSYGNGTSTGDSINYKGRTDGNNNLQTKSSVTTLINAAVTTEGNLAEGGVIKSTGGTINNSGSLEIVATGASGSGSFIIKNVSESPTFTIGSDGNTVVGGTLNVSSSSTFTGTATAMGDFALAKAAVAQSFNIRGAKLKELLIYAPDNSGSGDGTLNQVMRLGYSQNKSLRPFEITGNNTNGSDDVLRQTGRLTFTGTGDDGFIGKSGGTNNLVKIGAGTSAAGTLVATIGVLENGKRTFTSAVTTTDFIGTSTVWNKKVAESYNVVNGTAATYNDDGDMLSATVAAPITFTGNNIHNGTITQNGAVTHNADFTVNSNHAVYFKSAVFQSNGDYNFTGTSSSNLTQKIRNKGQASKVMLITATDTGNGEQNILSLAHAGSEFYRPITVPTPSADGHAATKSYVDTHANGVSGGQTTGTWTATFDGPGSPSTKLTATGNYVKTGKLIHVVLHASALNLAGYSNEIRIKGLPFKPDPNISGGFHLGKIHAVSFMINNAHADDGLVAVATYDSTYGNHIEVFSEQVLQKTHYLNNNSARVTISITYIAE
jgi:hypothetical protein